MADQQDAIEAQDTVKRNVVGILGVFVVLGVFLFTFFNFFRLD